MSIHARGHIRTRFITSLALGAVVGLSTVGQALAASSWTDPVGDATFHAPAYADIVAGRVDVDAGTFEFTLTVAEAIPAIPPLQAPGVQGFRWVTSLDLDSTSSPIGWPLPQRLPAAPQSASAARAEGFIAVAWNGSEFSGTWFDRRPLLSGGDVLATSVPFEIDGHTVHMWLDSSLIDDPENFGVGFATVALTTKLGTIIDQKQILDGLQPFYNQWP